MGPRTTCPDQMHLRLFFHEPGCTPEAVSVRAHLEQCEVCRAIVAGLESGDKIQNTLADAGPVPARGVVEAEEKNQNTVAGRIGAADEMCYVLSGDDPSQIGAADATRFILPGGNSGQIGPADATRYMLPGDNSGQIGPADSAT